MISVACLATIASGQVLNEDLKLTANDGAAGDEFGYSIAIDGDIVAVGSWRDSNNGSDSGSAYLFDAATGVQTATLLASDGAAGDRFATSIAVSDGIVAVGAYEDDDLGFGSGSVFLFDATTGVQLTKLLASDGAFSEHFGFSIAIDNGVVAVGARWKNDNGFNSGAAYLFDADTGVQFAKLLPSDGSELDNFGKSIAIDNGLVAVGATGDDDSGSSSGSAYLFDASTGVQLAKLLPNDGAEFDAFGWSVAIDNGLVVVGARNDDDQGNSSGSVYCFDVAAGSQLTKLLPSDGAAFDLFGTSVAINNGVVAVGGHLDDDNGFQSGSAYVFYLATPCPGDIADDFGVLAADGMVSFGDFLALLGLVGPCPGGPPPPPGCTGDIADDFGVLGEDGMVGFGDFLALLGLVGPCP